MIKPTEQMIVNVQLMGWEYLGECMFEKDGDLGYFTEEGWVKE